MVHIAVADKELGFPAGQITKLSLAGGKLTADSRWKGQSPQACPAGSGYYINNETRAARLPGMHTLLVAAFAGAGLAVGGLQPARDLLRRFVMQTVPARIPHRAWSATNGR